MTLCRPKATVKGERFICAPERSEYPGRQQELGSEAGDLDALASMSQESEKLTDDMVDEAAEMPWDSSDVTMPLHGSVLGK